MRQWLVAITAPDPLGRPDQLLDTWTVHDTRKAAEGAYTQALTRDDVWSAALCQIVRSTDFEGIEDGTTQPTTQPEV